MEYQVNKWINARKVIKLMSRQMFRDKVSAIHIGCPEMVPGLALRVPREAGRGLSHGGGGDLRGPEAGARGHQHQECGQGEAAQEVPQASRSR